MHQSACAVGPRRDFVAGVDLVRERAEFGAADGDDVADRMREALACCEAVLRGRKHRAAKEHETIGILVIGIQGLRH